MKYFCVIFLFLFYGCSASVRFTKEKNHGDEKPVEKGKFVEFKNYSVVESTEGVASYYAHEFNGRLTSNGEVYDMNGLTAAHPYFPFNTIIRVTNLDNNKIATVRINDRMPKHPRRIIDLSYGTAKELNMIGSGLANVRLDILEWGSE